MSEVLYGCRNCVYSERHGKEFGYFRKCILTGEDVSGKKTCEKYEPNDSVLLRENADLRAKLEQEKLTGSMLRAKLFESEDKRDELSVKIGKLEKYAELGRLAVEAMSKADGTVNSDPCIANAQTEVFKMLCGECYWLKFCQKRAELLAGEKYD